MKTKKVLTSDEMYAILSKKLSDYTGGVDQYVDFKSIAQSIGFKVTKLFRGKDHILDRVSGRYEVWLEITDFSSSKVGKGNSLGDAVKDAVSNCHTMNYIITHC